ncbi:thioredoxin family protein [Bacteroidales bacterium OttesenSCG-928-J19]|nr:thioredoxin family protein [Bacteroidales bacterium OttesenSCG-928-J19]
MKRIKYLLISLWFCGALSAQTINLYFPHFAGQEYDFFIFEGTKNDTIQKGAIPDDGRLTLTIPTGRMQYAPTAGYCGMGRWLLKNGGGLDFVVNGEDFSVSCTEAMPSDESIIYTGSAENDYFRNYFFRQQAIFQKMDVLNMGIEAYAKEKGNAIYPLFLSEKEKQDALFKDLVNNTQASAFYAARFRRMSDFLNGYPMYAIYGYDEEGQQKAMTDRRRYVEEELNMEALFTSGLWKNLISQSVSLYEDESAFIDAMISKLKATRSQLVYERLASDLVDICEQYNWHKQEELAYLLINDGRIKEPTGKLKKLITIYKMVKGSKAPALVGGKGDQRVAPTTNIILVFYETGCNSCDNEMQQLKGNYRLLKEKGYEVISISADADMTIFENTAKQFPWQHKYCDGEGFEGVDFQNYGVIGTPTIYVIDKKGFIQGRYARLVDTGIL